MIHIHRRNDEKPSVIFHKLPSHASTSHRTWWRSCMLIVLLHCSLDSQFQAWIDDSEMLRKLWITISIALIFKGNSMPTSSTLNIMRIINSSQEPTLKDTLTPSKRYWTAPLVTKTSYKFVIKQLKPKQTLRIPETSRRTPFVQVSTLWTVRHGFRLTKHLNQFNP